MDHFIKGFLQTEDNTCEIKYLDKEQAQPHGSCGEIRRSRERYHRLSAIC